MKRKNVCLSVIMSLILLICCGCGINNTESKNQSSVLRQEAKTEEKVQQTIEITAKQEYKEESAEKNVTDEKKQNIEKEQPFLVQIADDDPSIAYALVRIQNAGGLLPLPTEGEYTRTIRQVADDGTEAINVLHLTTNGIWMEDSNCEGHDCILEGEVTLENREERVLWNMIICLPHQLSVELITREEAVSLLKR